MAKEILNNESRSLREYRLLTSLTTSENVTSKVSLSTKLSRLPGKKDKFFKLNIPFISAAMQAVSGKRMAVALAQQGGLSVVACSLPIEEQVQIINEVKKFKGGFHNDVICLKKDDPIKKVVGIIKEKGYNTFPVTEDGCMKSRLLGVLRDKEFDVKEDVDKKVKDCMSQKFIKAKEGITLKEANKKMIEKGATHLYVVDKDDNLKFVVFKKDLLNQMEFPEGTIDENRSYGIGAAVSTQPSDKARIDALLNTQVDIIFIDSSDGFTEFQKQTLEYIRSKNKSIPVVGGNVITKEGFKYLAEAGFDAVKIGMGIGSGCITQEQKGTGRGQGTALMEINDERDKFFKKTGNYIPLISDGGISNSSHMVIALALGADTIMMGRYFAGFTESASSIRNHPKYGALKEYWMEASQRARNYGRYDTTKDLFFEEGTEGFVPHIGPLHNNIWEPIQKIKSAMSNAGCKDVDEFHKKAVVELQSIASIQDGGIHDIITN